METTKVSFWQRYSPMIKMSIIGILALLLLIPSAMIMQVINERQDYQRQVIDEIGNSWGHEQIISGPIISIPYNSIENNSTYIRYAHFLPETFILNGYLKSEFRSRSIFKVIGYKSDLTISGKLAKPDFSTFGKQLQGKLDTSGAIVQLPISDLKGIKDRIYLIVNGKSYEMNPGLSVQDISKAGLWCKIPLSELFSKGPNPNYEIKVSKLYGTQRLRFLPIGKETVINLSSDWGSPSFDGSFLPESRSWNDTSFKAKWKVLNLNRNFPQQFYGSNSDLQNSEFGVTLFQPVNHYTLSQRSAKYAILFISLTFLTFFFSEITNNRKIHPIQYILIGLALVLFFSLLLSLSEQIGFDKAYFVASSAIILMVVMYAQSILKNMRLTGIIAGILILLYGFIYIILQLENMALLFGSIGLFVILALVMFISRKIDWYNVGIKKVN